MDAGSLTCESAEPHTSARPRETSPPPLFLNFYPWLTRVPRSRGGFVRPTGTLPWVLKQDDTRNMSHQVICDLEEQRWKCYFWDEAYWFRLRTEQNPQRNREGRRQMNPQTHKFSVMGNPRLGQNSPRVKRQTSIPQPGGNKL